MSPFTSGTESGELTYLSMGDTRLDPAAVRFETTQSSWNMKAIRSNLRYVLLVFCLLNLCFDIIDILNVRFSKIQFYGLVPAYKDDESDTARWLKWMFGLPLLQPISIRKLEFFTDQPGHFACH
ncbi:hypothetical protein GE061_013899 [Apolygus lucorum]|uniref:Uncharacterized protein n=1 Tax=Apolygus lucorum TaxID=248454 RepID=A0A8S9XRB0_APOLU|nr:hypothetical protein GE061_013899 [Apolygus lucorum]